MKFILLFTITSFFSFCGITQSDFYKLVLQPGFSYNYQLSTIKNGNTTDLLSKAGRHYTGFNMLQGTYFFNKKFGLTIKGSFGGQIDDSNKKSENIFNQIHSDYSPNYYTSQHRLVINQGVLGALSIGPAYRLIYGKWNFQLNVLLGFSQLENNSIYFNLKEHGSNNHYSAIVDQDYSSSHPFTCESSILIGFKLKKRLGIFVNLSHLMIPITTNGSIKTTDLFTKDIQTETYTTKTIIQKVGGGIGLSINLGNSIE